MEKIIGYWSTTVTMTPEEAKNICKIDEGEKCCAFVVCGQDGFRCIRFSYPENSSIFAQLKNDSMNAKGEGGWKGCF